jgi:transcriptional regulator with XRE-family HTH domain
MNEKELLMAVSSNIRRYRLIGKLSQSALSEKADVSINFISDIENGKKWPSIQTMIKFAKVFDVEVYELLKPEGVLPDNSGQVIAKYTKEILATINKSVENVEAKYAAQLKRRP